MIAKLALTIGLFTFASFSGAEAFECRTFLRNAKPNEVSQTKHLRLDPVSTREAIELLGDDGMGARSLRITREAEDVWLAKVRRNLPESAIHVTYRFSGSGGSSDRMRHIDDSKSSFRALIQPLPIRTLCRRGLYKVISGGFRLIGIGDDVSRPGSYLADLEVTLEVPG